MPLRLLVQHLAHVILPTAQGLAESSWDRAESLAGWNGGLTKERAPWNEGDNGKVYCRRLARLRRVAGQRGSQLKRSR